MSGNRIRIIIAAAVAFGCSESAVAPTARSDGPTLRASVRGPVVHRATVGGPDACAGIGAKPGCDANFSLVALQRADGSVTGQWVDQFAQPYGGVQIAVNCLNVIGNNAWVSGVVTLSKEFAGLPAITRVEDNGTSANDPPDRISVSIIDPGQFGLSASCLDAEDLPLLAAPQGQAVVVQ